MAAGSVMNDPSMGAMVKIDSHHAAGLCPPKPATTPRIFSESLRTGLVEAKVMITTKNIGSM